MRREFYGSRAKDQRRARGKVTWHRQVDIGQYLVEGVVVPRVIEVFSAFIRDLALQIR